MAAPETSHALDCLPQVIAACQGSTGSASTPGNSVCEGDPPSSIGEHQAVISRCVVRSIHDSVSRFDERKRTLVKDIGFGGFLHFPPLKTLDRRFSVWLMNRVDERVPSLVIDGERTLTFSKQDLGKVFGIPSSGRRVVDRRSARKERKEALDKNFPARSITAVQEVVDRDYGRTMSKEQEDNFKVSFVVFVMSCVLVPCSKHDYVTAEYWDALVKPDEINKFDWAAYVLHRLIEAVLKLKSDLERKVRVTNLTGCSLFLQVLYLDSVDLGVWNCSHRLLPRIRSFTDERLRYMIDADCKSVSNSRTPNCQYGRSRLRPPSDVCYSWAASLEGTDSSLLVCEQGGLWEDTLLMARQLKLPTGVAGHVYMAIEDHRRRMNEVALRQGRNLVRAVANIVRPFMDGFNYKLDYDSSIWTFGSDGTSCSGLDAIQQARCFMCGFDHPGMVEPGFNFGMPVESWNGTPGSGNVASGEQPITRQRKVPVRGPILFGDLPEATKCNVGSLIGRTSVFDMLLDSPVDGPCVEAMVMHAMSRFYMLSRQCKYPRRLDLNKSAYGAEEPPLPVVVQLPSVSGCPLSPWVLGFDSDRGYDEAVGLMDQYEGLVKGKDLHRPWFVHNVPKYVEVDGGDAWSQFIGEAEMEMDMMDVLMRRFIQVDDGLYSHRAGHRWRHFAESDFLALLVAGWPKCFEVCSREQLAGGHMKYHVPECGVIFSPSCWSIVGFAMPGTCHAMRLLCLIPVFWLGSPM